MKRIGKWMFLACLLVLPGLLGANEGKVTIKAVLIVASNEAGKVDPRLKPYESKLRSLFKFKNYRQLDTASSALSLPGDATLSLPEGMSLQLVTSAAASKKMRTQVKWRRGKKMLIDTTLAMRRGAPTVLGGPSYRGGNLILILVAK